MFTLSFRVANEPEQYVLNVITCLITRLTVNAKTHKKQKESVNYRGWNKMEPFSCQPLFDRLTHIAIKTKALNDFAKLRTSVDKIKYCWNAEVMYDGDTLISFRKEIQQILEVLYSQCADHRKSETLATQAKEKGLKAYLKKKDAEAHHNFTECLRYAPKNSPILPITYGNRSAVLFQMGRYKEALEDIGRAENKGCPIPISCKLLARRCSCYVMLGKRDQAETALNSFRNYLSCVPADVKDKYEKVLMDLESKIQGMSLTNNTSINEEEELEPPPLFQSESPVVTYMSSALDMRVNEVYGRHVVATESVEKGSVVFVEKPYAAILLPEHHRTHCHNCFGFADNPIPCLLCPDAVFCKEECFDQGIKWHQYECGILHILSSVGIAHLALRVILVTGWELYCRVRDEGVKIKVPGVSTKNAYNGRTLIDGYRAVFHLMPHLDSSLPDDQLQYCLAAVMLASAVLDKTTFCEQINSSDNSNSRLLELNVIHLATAVMRHIAQLVANAHAITQVIADPCGRNKDLEEVVQKRIATAIYPTASLMNHSCKPTIINSFLKDLLVIRTIQDVQPEDQIYNCYGPHYCRQTFKERQDSLQLQYFFTCKCGPCTEPEYKVRETAWSGFHCETCNGVAAWIGGEESGIIEGESTQGLISCLVCHSTEKPSQNFVQTCTKVNALQEEAEEALQKGDFSTAAANLRKAINQGCKVYLPENHYFITLRDTLAKTLLQTGDFEMCCQELRECLHAAEVRYGAESVELAHELLKFSDVLCLAAAKNKKLKNEQQKVLEKTNTLFTLHYGPSWRKYLKI